MAFDGERLVPELPEVETTRLGLLPMLGSSVLKLEVMQTRLRLPVSENLSAIEGLRLDTLTRRGKYLLLGTAKGSALIHLGMSGSLRLTANTEPYRKHDHVALILNNDWSLRFHDPRRFGLFLWLEDEPLNHKLLATLGPEPLTPAFNAEHLYRLSRTKKQAIKSFIMDGHVVVGVGNIYANEALFYAGIHPLTPAKHLALSDYQRLYQHIYRILSAAIERGGTTLRDFVNSKGDPGYFQQELMVYGREGKPCMICQQSLQLVRVNNRSTVYCSHCQPAFSE